ncbi:MurR/RpiR family transcriptional regulator [Bradyrhizobium sp.]|uniref:MurR/RpiR family transcriptional regulator n=1 Tax=Bradyrhizobium sp. TaxID=376 RepID=UPI003C7DD4C8
MGVAMSGVVAAGLDNDLDSLLRQTNEQLGAAGRRVAKFIDENRQTVLASSAAALGGYIGTSDATVLRTIQAMGFAGLADLKQAILKSGDQTSTPADQMLRTLADLEQSTGRAMASVLKAHDEGLAVLKSEKCRAQIAAAIHCLDAAKRVVVFAIGPSAALAGYVATSLRRCGRACQTLNATGSMLADQLLDLRRGDVLLILAYGRLYREVRAVFAEAKELGLPTVLVTEAEGTPLAKLADIAVAIPRGRPEQVALHGATFVGLEAMVLSLAAAKPDAAVASLDKLNRLRRVTEIPGKAKNA